MFHDFCLHRVTWWQLGLNSKEDILCYTVPIVGLRLAEQDSLRLPALLQERRHLHAETSVFKGGGSLRIRKSTAEDGGNSDQRNIQVVLFQLRVSFSLCPTHRSHDLGS